jgi:hypothetical protein
MADNPATRVRTSGSGIGRDFDELGAGVNGARIAVRGEAAADRACIGVAVC